MEGVADEVDISDELKKSTAVILEFNVQNVTNSQSVWGEKEWESQRIAIQMAKGYEGFLFFLPKGEANVFDMTDGSFADANKTRFGGSGAALSWIDTLMRGENGVNMRIVRTGENVTLFVQNGEGEWVKIGTVACGEAETEIIFYGCGVEWAFTSVSAKKIEYVAEQAPAAGKPGNVEYYTDGTNYWLADGTMVTRADTVVKFEVAVTLNLSGVALDGSNEDVAAGTVLTFTSSKATYTYTVGTTKDFKMSPETYTLTAEGYRPHRRLIEFVFAAHGQPILSVNGSLVLPLAAEGAGGGVGQDVVAAGGFPVHPEVPPGPRQGHRAPDVPDVPQALGVPGFEDAVPVP